MPPLIDTTAGRATRSITRNTVHARTYIDIGAAAINRRSNWKRYFVKNAAAGTINYVSGRSVCVWLLSTSGMDGIVRFPSYEKIILHQQIQFWM